KQVFSVFMNNVKDFRWKVTLTEKYGALVQLSPIYHFNQLAAYSVTYLKLEKSPAVPLLGTIAVNEKSLLQELVISVQNSTTTISELMRKEEDKKVSDWITPTLLNGWVGHGSTGVSIRKNGDHLEIKGAIRAGVAISGTHIMRLPNELRPS
ncbi:hypothetical protein, partial [Clostridium perfringens]|uniref:hypothetical protein n=1 Tax=Clostridium perfringens TaxID=1502 RepID=UPI002ACBFA59